MRFGREMSPTQHPTCLYVLRLCTLGNDAIVFVSEGFFKMSPFDFDHFIPLKISH